MLWAVRNKWHSGALFSFKFYLHWATLMIRSGNGTVHFHHRKEWVIQGVPLDLIACGLVIPPLIQDLETAHPRITRPWYDDDAGAGGTFYGIRQHLDNLMMRGSP